MNFQEKLFETTAALRSRAAAIADVAVSTTRARAGTAAKRLVDVKKLVCRADRRRPGTQ